MPDWKNTHYAKYVQHSSEIAPIMFGAFSVIWLAPNSAHQGHRIVGAEGNLGTHDW